MQYLTPGKYVSSVIIDTANVTRLVPSWITQQCAWCRLPIRSEKRLCKQCITSLPYLQHACYQCANPLPENNANLALCGHCIRQAPYFHHAIASCHYQTPIIEWIHQYKFEHNLFYGAVLAELLLEKVKLTYKNEIALPNCIIPVPLHASRLRHRGFNQALELAKPLARTLKLPLLRFAVKRQRATRPQTGLTAKQRQHNVSNAFCCRVKLPYQHVALVDDVMTTASTLNAVAQCLCEQDIQQIDVWCCARRGYTDN